jgi:hypothetical protein
MDKPAYFLLFLAQLAAVMSHNSLCTNQLAKDCFKLIKINGLIFFFSMTIHWKLLNYMLESLFNLFEFNLKISSLWRSV